MAERFLPLFATCSKCSLGFTATRTGADQAGVHCDVCLWFLLRVAKFKTEVLGRLFIVIEEDKEGG